MFERIGKKIKGLAKFIAFTESIIFAFVGILILKNSNDSERLILTGLAVMVLGPIIACISSWLAYGFGELIDQTTIIANATASPNSSHNMPSPTPTTYNATNSWRCSCGRVNANHITTCSCGAFRWNAPGNNSQQHIR